MCASFTPWFTHRLQQRETWAFKRYLPLATGAGLATPSCCVSTVLALLILQKYTPICSVPINRSVCLSSGTPGRVILEKQFHDIFRTADVLNNLISGHKYHHTATLNLFWWEKTTLHYTSRQLSSTGVGRLLSLCALESFHRSTIEHPSFQQQAVIDSKAFGRNGRKTSIEPLLP